MNYKPIKLSYEWFGIWSQIKSLSILLNDENYSGNVVVTIQWHFFLSLQILFSLMYTVPASTHCSETGNCSLRFTGNMLKGSKIF